MKHDKHKEAPAVNMDGINPIPLSHREMSPMDYAMVFWSSTIIVQIMVIGLYLLNPIGQLNFLQVLGVGVVSSCIVSFFASLNGDAGMRYGIPFIIQARSGFGVKGARIVAILRSVPAIAWNGIGCWIGGMAIQSVTQQMFGFGNVWAGFFFILIVQAFLAYEGITSIAAFDKWMSILIGGMLIYFFYVVFSTGKVDFTKALEVKGSLGLAFWAGVMGAAANFTTVVLSSSDLIRHINPGPKKNLVGSSMFANFFGIVPPWMFMIISGIIIGLATGATDPIEGLVELAPNKAFGIILLVFIIIAQITSNLTLNIMPPALALQEMFGLTWGKGVVAVAILSVLSAPWILFSSDYFFTFQNIYSSFFGPATAVLIADYYIIRKKQLNVELLYDKEGTYKYVNGYSMAGMITLVVGAIVSFIFLDYSWLVGFPFSIVFYTLLKKTGIERKFEDEEAALGSEFRTSFH